MRTQQNPRCPNCQSTATAKHDHDLRNKSFGRDTYYKCRRCGNKFETR